MVVVAPAPQRAVGLARAGVEVPCGDLGHKGAKRAHLHRRGLVARGAVTELALEVQAPAPERAVGLARAGVANPCGDLSHQGAKRAHLHRRGLVARGAVAELAVDVAAPAPQRAVGLTRAGVEAPCGDLGHKGAKRAHLHRRGLVDDVAVAKLALEVLAPAPERAVGLARAGVANPCGDLSHQGAKRAHLHRRGLGADVAVAELAVGVAAPAPERAVGLACAGMVVPCGKLQPAGSVASRAWWAWIIASQR